ncbi:aminotransferase class I/II-fold pyridoxal phosphate-dependent enzyme [Halobacillus litoralis]|uniref:Aminotransferase n=1 Tax=Halobacillus litoralis TaxID=45668 RepID=A0A845FFM2_9BACI|nr:MULTISPECIES: aminotransferase class I/II-fold pyridoxal phosphate-dependent enzyme [Halobacillus]MEC3885424.1 aminotransferase class I/II-fold pyridoxal phosphate-dependent enzyme [Halobacillus sp. HZG1]MYL72416.1 aminotransferase class I/II-fold pyridoxal phosphate-dependent enzyme [Halobacillus litoralis]
MIQSSKQVQSLPPYLFSIFHKKKVALTAQGVDVIDLGIGAPDLPTPPFIIDRLTEEVRKPKNHKYSPYGGCREFREAVADFYRSHYDVDLDPETEVLTLIGSKEGIAHLISAVLDPGDGVLAPDPGYPVYQSAIHLAHGVTVRFPLDEENSYAPLFDQISPRDVSRSKMMLLNYPNNPTGGTVDLETFEEAVRFAKEHHLSLIQDAAYDLVTFGDYKAPSLLQVPGAKEIAVEFGSLSKTFNMSGWRLGYVVGNQELIRALSVYKSNMDTSQFLPIQLAGATALRSDFSSVKANNRTYEQRLDLMMNAFNGMNIQAEKPKGTFFLWARVPEGYTSQEFSEKMLDEAGIILTPGTAFGQKGEGYFRMSLSVPIERLHEASIRMRKAMKGG